MNTETKSEFEKASQKKESHLVAEIWAMLKQNKKFWLIPLVAGLLFLGVIVILGGTAAAPFIYSLF
jgi:hypothetical protein